jgi:hypothetical protein
VSAEPTPDTPPEHQPREPKLGDFFFIGTACALSVVGAGAIGFFLDSAFGTQPWLTFVGLAFGITSAVLLTIVNLRKFT